MSGTRSIFGRVKKEKSIEQEFDVDKLTNSIENTVTGDSFATDVSFLSRAELSAVSKNSGWQFDWKAEFKCPAREVYKLTIVNNQHIIQGLMSVEVKSDHVYMHLLESAPFNKGKSKMYAGVPGNLVAFVCKLSFQRGHQGNVAFLSKSGLIKHYVETLDAVHIGGRVMLLNTMAALKLLDRYFP